MSSVSMMGWLMLPLHGKVEAVERQECMEALQEFGLDCLVGLPLDRAAGDRGGDQRRHKRHAIALQKPETGIGSQLSSAKDRELVHAGPQAAVSAALNADAAVGNPQIARGHLRGGDGGEGAQGCAFQE
jgi:hypothetical protein